MATAGEDRAVERLRMVSEISSVVTEVAEVIGRGALSIRVLDAMRKVPRHEFVPAGQRKAAYKNRPLPIGHGQTISQPFIVALMTELLSIGPDDKVLEIGTGSGYQAAILSLLVREVYSIELVDSLGKQAAETLQRLGYCNVTLRIGDGYSGWSEEAPFDAIIVAAAPDHVPPALIEQLKPGGRLVIPVGVEAQDLQVIEKAPDGSSVTTNVIPVRFVPLIRGDN